MQNKNQHSKPIHPKYRADIDGLRAIAVLSVVLYHAFPSLLTGGFVGVDVFFVISGYLISTIIFGNLQNSSFSYLDFYIRRARRIFPALILVLLTVFAIGWNHMLVDGFKNLGEHIAAGAGFASNLLLWNESGYFTAAAATKPLLHLWSLGIEEQFYLLWPTVLIILWRSNLGRFSGIVLLIIVSFSWNIIWTTSNPVAAFYSPQTRLWELALGSLVACIQIEHPLRTLTVALTSPESQWRTTAGKIESVLTRPAMREFSALVGLSLILLTSWRANSAMAFPGYLALAPTLGAALCIASGPSTRVAKWLLSGKPLVWIGLISYPLYLWHWPILVFQDTLQYQFHGPLGRVAAIALAIFLAAFTYYCIERFIRHGAAPRAKAATLLTGLLLIGGLGVFTFTKDGLPDRPVVTKNGHFVSDLAKIQDVYKFYAGNFRWGTCYSAPREVTKKDKMRMCVDSMRPLVLIWGDSYSASLYPGLLKLQSKKVKAFGIAQFSDSNVPPFFDDSKRSSAWPENNRTLAEVNAEKLDIVSETRPAIVLITWMVNGQNSIQDKSQAAGEVAKTVALIKQKSPVTRVVVVGPVPHWYPTLKDVIVRFSTEKDGAIMPAVSTYGLQEDPGLWDTFLSDYFARAGIEYISPLKYLCDARGCLDRTGDDATDLITMDWGHLTNHGSEVLWERMSKEIYDRLP